MNYHARNELEGLLVVSDPDKEVPTPAPFLYTSREVINDEVVQGEYGEILVIAPRTILTGRNGYEFAVDPETLARDYVEVPSA
jgi:hypothetical protein